MKYGRATVRYAARPTQNLDVALIARLAAEKRPRMPARVLVVTRQAGGPACEAMRQAGIEFLDTAGNAFLDLPGLHLFVTGRKLAARDLQGALPRSLGPAAVRVLFVYLCDLVKDRRPSTWAINRPQRDTAARAGVSLGIVSLTRRRLDTTGLLQPLPGNHVGLVNVPELLERWVRGYTELLRPKLIVGRYRSPGPDWWREARLDPAEALWGGEPAAAKMTDRLQPGVVTIYRRQGADLFLARQGLRLDPHGDVEVLDIFWQGRDIERDDCVPPLLVYADLVGSRVGRNLEVATSLYDRELRKAYNPD